MIALQLARAVYGSWLITRGDHIDKVAGARYVAQALITAPYAGRHSTHVVAATIDSIHALSMYTLTAADPHRRRTSIADAIGATIFAAAEAIEANRKKPLAPSRTNSYF